MKFIALFIAACIILYFTPGCNLEPHVKPFIVITKQLEFNKNGLAFYRYIDADTNTESFTDSASKYDVGDTIK